MKNNRYGDLLLLCFTAGVISGTALGNLMGGRLLEQAGYLETLMAAAGSVSRAERSSFLLGISGQRFLETGIMWLLSMTVFAVPCFLLLSLYGGFSVGMMISVLTSQKGLFGLPVYLSSVFPQYLFYLPVWLAIAAAAGRERQRIKIPVVTLGIALTAAGVWSEAMLNPIFLKMFRL